MDDVAREIAEIQNCQLSSEVKSMLLSSYSTDDIVLALQINQPTASSTAHKPEEKLVQAKEAGDAIQDHRKDESPSLPSPQQSKAKRAVDPSFDDDVHSSENSTIITSQEVQQQAMHSNPLQKGKDHDPEENTKVDRHHNLINVDESSETIEEPLSQENQQPKENVAVGSEMNLKEKSESVNGIEKDITFSQIHTSSSSSEIHPEEIAIQTNIQASTQVVPAESHRFSMENESFVIKELNGNSNGEKDETIYPQKAICRHCSKLISQESLVFNTKCKCTKTSLVHEGCKDAWSLEKGDKCLHCDHEIVCTRVMVSSSEENHQITISTSDRSWCCLW